MFIDTHIHWNNPQLMKDLPRLIERAFDVDVKTFLVIGFDHQTNEDAIKLAERYPFVYAAVGYHPTIAHTLKEEDYDTLQTYLKHPKVKAVGEFGIDLYWEKDTLDAQILSMKRQIELAQTHQLPIIIHMREGTQVTYETLKPYAPLKGVMHCYSGSHEMMTQFLDLGMHIGLGGPVTFKNAKIPKLVAKDVPMERLLLETDAPYLAPHPHRGKTNGAHFIPLIAECIAQIKDVSIETIQHKTTHNARTLFSLEEGT